MTSQARPAQAVGYTAAIVTYRRADSLTTVLEGLLGQSVVPSLTVVADNDPDQSARAVVETAQRSWPNKLVYAPVGQNLGPAGGWAHAVAVAAPDQARRGKWVLVIDDDDPIEHPDLVEGLLEDARLNPERLGGIGLRGSRWAKKSCRLVRAEAPEGSTAVVDYLAGGGAPLYSWAAINEVGFFKADLFFGFEDLEFGYRVRESDWRLLVAPHPSLHTVADTTGVRTAWREYYKTRALSWIVREHEGVYAVVVTVLRSVLLGGLRLATAGRQPSLLKARLWGAWDGLRGHLGVRRYFPGSNPPKSSSSARRDE